MAISVRAGDADIVPKLEADLRERIVAAADVEGITAAAYSVFDLDELEAMRSSQLGETCASVTLGVGYNGTSPVGDRDTLNSAVSIQAAKMVELQFLIIAAVRADGGCDTKAVATTLLTAVRNAVIGKQPGSLGRPWRFIQERPEPSVSTRSVVYYSQVWQVSVPVVSK